MSLYLGIVVCGLMKTQKKVDGSEINNELAKGCSQSEWSFGVEVAEHWELNLSEEGNSHIDL